MMVFLVEEDPAVREICTQLLADAGYRVIAATAGLRLTTQIQAHHPWVVVVSVVGPDDAGLALCRDLKAGLLPVPAVILLSTYPHAGDLQTQAGADGALRMPFDSDDFLNLVRSLQP